MLMLKNTNTNTNPVAMSSTVAILFVYDCYVFRCLVIETKRVPFIIFTVLSIRFKVGGYLGMAPAGVILEVQNFFSLENF